MTKFNKVFLSSILILSVIIIFNFVNRPKEYVSIILPQELFGGGTAEKVIATVKNNDTFLLETGEEIPLQTVIHEIILNEDGSLTYLFYKDKLDMYREAMYAAGELKLVTKFTETSIQYAEYADFHEGIPFGLNVYVDSEKYNNNMYDGAMANLYGATYIGFYQILSGIEPDDWYVRIIVMDYKTKEVISNSLYPTE